MDFFHEPKTKKETCLKVHGENEEKKTKQNILILSSRLF